MYTSIYGNPHENVFKKLQDLIHVHVQDCNEILGPSENQSDNALCQIDAKGEEGLYGFGTDVKKLEKNNKR